MHLLRQLAIAEMSRLNGGLFFDQFKSPIHPSKITQTYNSIRDNVGGSSYHHLDEETLNLTTYTLTYNGTYTRQVRTLPLSEANALVMKYEVATGFRPANKRYRKKFIEGNFED